MDQRKPARARNKQTKQTFHFDENYLWGVLPLVKQERSKTIVNEISQTLLFWRVTKVTIMVYWKSIGFTNFPPK